MHIYKIVVNKAILTEDIQDLTTAAWIDATIESERVNLSNQFNMESARHFKFRSSTITEKELAHDFEVDFYLFPQTLITLHSGLVTLKVNKTQPVRDALDIMLSILFEEITRIDVQLQLVENNVQDLSAVIFNVKKNTGELREAIVSIGYNSQLVLRLNRCLKNIIDELEMTETEVCAHTI